MTWEASDYANNKKNCPSFHGSSLTRIWFIGDNIVQWYGQKICLKSAILDFPGRKLPQTAWWTSSVRETERYRERRRETERGGERRNLYMNSPPKILPTSRAWCLNLLLTNCVQELSMFENELKIIFIWIKKWVP